MLIVMKFGGTSVGSAERIASAADLVTKAVARGDRVIVEASAMSGITNGLIEAARSASKGEWDSTIRREMDDRHRKVADVLIEDPARRQAALEAIDRRLERFEKLCFGLSMVHELTP